MRCDLIKIMFLYSRHVMQSVTFLLKMGVNEILRYFLLSVKIIGPDNI